MFVRKKTYHKLKRNCQKNSEIFQTEINNLRKEIENSQKQIIHLRENLHKNFQTGIKLNSNLADALEELVTIKSKDLSNLETKLVAIKMNQGNIDHGNIEIIEDSNHNE
ncbi:8868_t:CDS:1 [Funneliformis caledonium]|uniref:8868_t:CDS:1 n=1 Tax=Funneliformis caledonium TaxID=1117310 RepID=A0A9N9DKT6_9GLOM|nr:8868_t:CDS:1 [Funneliformis caledonium]